MISAPAGKFTPVAVPLDILYEDADLLALNKPRHAVHGGYDRGEPTVANALAAYLGPDAVFHPVNRLDRGTSGVMLVARSGYVHDRLRRVLHTGDFQLHLSRRRLRHGAAAARHD